MLDCIRLYLKIFICSTDYAHVHGFNIFALASSYDDTGTVCHVLRHNSIIVTRIEGRSAIVSVDLVIES